MQNIIDGWFKFDFNDGRFVVGQTKKGTKPNFSSQEEIIKTLKLRKKHTPGVFESNTSDLAKIMLSLLDV